MRTDSNPRCARYDVANVDRIRNNAWFRLGPYLPQGQGSASYHRLELEAYAWERRSARSLRHCPSIFLS